MQRDGCRGRLAFGRREKRTQQVRLLDRGQLQGESFILFLDSVDCTLLSSNHIGVEKIGHKQSHRDRVIVGFGFLRG